MKLGNTTASDIFRRVEGALLVERPPGLEQAYVEAWFARHQTALTNRIELALQSALNPSSPSASSRIAEPTGDELLERWQAQGGRCLTDVELLTLLLSRRRGRHTSKAARASTRLLEQLGGLKPILGSSVAELRSASGLATADAILVAAVGELARRVTQEEPEERLTIRNARDVFDAYRARMSALEREEFVVLLLDTRNRRIHDVTVSRGSLTEAVVHPREVFLPAVRAVAARIIAVHNHPSGDPTPSAADIELTRRLRETGKVLGIELLDHVVIGRRTFVSLGEMGLVR